MANRRTISVQISLSEQVAALSEFSQLLYTWAILHADDWGVLHASPRRLKAQVMPLSDRPASDFESAVNEWVFADLVLGFVHDNERYVLFPTFEQHQTGLDKRTRARALPHPMHTEGCQNFTCGSRTAEKFSELLGNSALREEKRREENGTEEGLAPAAADAQPEPPAAPVVVVPTATEDVTPEPEEPQPHDPASDTPTQAAIRRVWDACQLDGPPTPPTDAKGKTQAPAYTTLIRILDTHGIPRFERFAAHCAESGLTVPDGAKPWPWFVETVKEAMQAPWKWDPLVMPGKPPGGNGSAKRLPIGTRDDFADAEAQLRAWEAGG